MNDRLTPEDPQLTAYALGELEGDERAAIEAALRRDPALRMIVEEIRAAASRLEAALAEEVLLPPSRGPFGAPAELRGAWQPANGAEPARVNGHHARRRPPAKLLAFPQLYFVVGGAAAAGVALFLTLQPPPAPAPVTTPPRVAVGVTAPEAPAAPVSENVAPPDAAPPVIVSVPNVTVPAPERDESLAGSLALIDRARPLEPAPIEFKFTIPSIGAMAMNGGSLPVGAGNGQRVTPPPEIMPGDFRSTAMELSNQAYVRRQNEAKFSLPWPKFGGQNTGRPAAEKPAPAPAPPPQSAIAPASSDPITPEMLERARAGAVPGSSTDLFSGPRRVGVGGRRDGGRAGRGAFQRSDGFISVAQTTVSHLPLLRETGSYADVQRYIRGRQLPPPATVRIEEMLNSFPYRYAAPSAATEPFAATLEVAEAPWAPAHRLVRIGLKARDGAADATSVAIANEVLARVEFNPEKVSGYRLIGYEPGASDDRAAAPEAPRLNEATAGMSLTVLYEIVPAGTTESGPDVVVLIEELKYGMPRKGRPALPPEIARELLTLTVQYREPADDTRRKLEFPLVDAGAGFAAASPDFKFATAVAGFGLILRNSPQKGAATMGHVIEWARGGVTGPDDDRDGLRAEFIELARQAQALLRGE